MTNCTSSCCQRLDVVWRNARWIMDCLHCVRSKQWVGVVPLGLVMGGEPPPRPDGEEAEQGSRLTWPRCTRRAVTGIKGGTCVGWSPVFSDNCTHPK